MTSFPGSSSNTKINPEDDKIKFEKDGCCNAVLQEIREKIAYQLTTNSSMMANKKLTTILSNIYTKEYQLHPLSMRWLWLNGYSLIPKSIFIPPSQVVLLMAEYDSNGVTEELLRKLTGPEKNEQNGEKLISSTNDPGEFRNAAAAAADPIQHYSAVHMTNFLYKHGRNIVMKNWWTVGKDGSQALVSSSSGSNRPRQLLECHLCKFKTESLIVLETHKEIPHYIRHRYRCSYCTKSVSSFKEILFHFFEKHGVKARDDSWCSPWECPACAKDCGNKRYMMGHRRHCALGRTGYTMVGTVRQSLCAINEVMWDADPNYCYIQRCRRVTGFTLE